MDEKTGLLDSLDNLKDSIKENKFTVGELIDMYDTNREELRAEKKSYDAKEKSYKELLEIIEVAILGIQRELGVKSLSSDNLTAYQSNVEKVRMNDWEVFSDWVLSSGNIQCVEKRPAKLACLEIKDEGTNLSDIGLSYEQEVVVRIRKK